MSWRKPQFELRQVFGDASIGPPRLYPVESVPWAETAVERRGLLGAAVTFPAVMAALSARAAAQARSSRPGVLRAHNGGVYALRVSRDGKTLFSGSDDKTIRVWDLAGTKLRGAPGTQRGEVYDLVTTPSDALLAAALSDGTIQLWAVQDGKLLHTIAAHGGRVMALAVTPDGGSLASASADRTVKMWHVPNGGMPKTLRGHEDQVHSLAVSGDGRLLASGGADRSVRLWSLPGGTEVATLEGHTGAIGGLAYSADGTALYSGGADGTLIQWSVADRSPVKRVSGHVKDINALALTGSNLLATCSDDQTVKLWSLPSLDPVVTLLGHNTIVTALAASPDGKTLISGDLKGSIIIWDVATRKLRSYLFDPTINEKSITGLTYTSRDIITGQVITYTLPCGSPIPPGAVCVCNCVPGTYEPAPVPVPPARTFPTYPTYSSPSVGGTTTTCACDKVCTCVPVYHDL